MAPIFYRGADGAVIVFDVNKRESFELAGKWFEELNNFAPIVTNLRKDADVLNAFFIDHEKEVEDLNA